MQAVEILVPISLFLIVFGIFYIYFTTRHRERLALIEKGADASLFHTGNSTGTARKLIIRLLNCDGDTLRIKPYVHYRHGKWN